jgi:hypothetical protein
MMTKPLLTRRFFSGWVVVAALVRGWTVVAGFGRAYGGSL